MILYLHGFRSSPASHKAQQMRARLQARGLAEHFVCPALPVSPQAAVALAEALIAGSPTPVTLIGSSLGGYYATYLSEKYRLRAALVNPAVVAHLSLSAYLGEQTNLYTGERFAFTRMHIAELQALELPVLQQPGNFWLLVETGDELLDYRQAVARYAGGRQTVIDGGDHSFTHWEEYLDELIDFAGF